MLDTHKFYRVNQRREKGFGELGMGGGGGDANILTVVREVVRGHLCKT